MELPRIEVGDGVGTVSLGDVLVVVWAAHGRLHRMRYLLDRSEAMLARRTGTVLLFQLVLPGADPPDRESWAEARERMNSSRSRFRRFITVPLGDDLRLVLVRAVLRTVAMLVRDARGLTVCSTLDEGIAQVRDAASKDTPSALDLRAAIASLCDKLGVRSDTLSRRR